MRRRCTIITDQRTRMALGICKSVLTSNKGKHTAFIDQGIALRNMKRKTFTIKAIFGSKTLTNVEWNKGFHNTPHTLNEYVWVVARVMPKPMPYYVRHCRLNRRKKHQYCAIDAPIRCHYKVATSCQDDWPLSQYLRSNAVIGVAL